MLNRCILVGRLTKDPELQHTQSDIPVGKFTIAVDRPFNSTQTGDKETDFLPVVVWRKQAENVFKFTKKGSLVAVEGRIQVRNYDDRDGVKRYVTEIIADNVIFLESKKSQEEYSQQDSSVFNNYQSNDQKDEDKYESNVSFTSNDLPF